MYLSWFEKKRMKTFLQKVYKTSATVSLLKLSSYLACRVAAGYDSVY